jgi:hypothetical protein
MTVCFIWEHETPARPIGEDVEVVYDVDSQHVLTANYLSNGYPLFGRPLHYLRRSVAEGVEFAKGWDEFQRHYIRVLPECGA